MTELWLAIVVDDGEINFGVYPSKAEAIEWIRKTYSCEPASNLAGEITDDMDDEEALSEIGADWDVSVEQLDVDHIRSLIAVKS